jgi:hypothetical protein
MSAIESEHDRRVREYWARAYDNLFANNKNKLPYEPTAVLTSPTKERKIKLRLKDMLDLDFSH